MSLVLHFTSCGSQGVIILFGSWLGNEGDGAFIGGCTFLAVQLLLAMNQSNFRATIFIIIFFSIHFHVICNNFDPFK